MRHFTPGANVTERASLPPPVAVSTVVFALRGGQLVLPLVRRTRNPFLGSWALPGGPVTWDESLTQVARRTLASVTSLRPLHLEQLYTFGDPSRSPAERLISIVYWAQIGPGRTGDETNVEWFPVTTLPNTAFDHASIIHYALDRLRARGPLVIGRLLGESFTLAQLWEATQTVMGEPCDYANFRRDILRSGHVQETGTKSSGGTGRPAKLYRLASGN